MSKAVDAAVGTNGTSRDGRALSGVVVLAWLGLVTLGFNTTRVAGLAISDLLFAACGLVLVARLVTGQTGDLAGPTMRRNSPLILVGTILMLTGGTLSAFVAWDSLWSIQVVARLAWLTLAWFWILRTVCRDRFLLAKAVNGWRIGVVVQAVVAVVSDLGIVHVGTENIEGRQTAFFAQPNELATLLAVGLPLFILDVPGRGEGMDERRSMAVRFTQIGLIGWAIASTGSMTGTLAAAAGAVAAIAVAAVTKGRAATTRRRNPLRPLVAIGIVIGGLTVLSTSDLPVVERFTRFQEGDAGVEASVETRELRNEQAIERLPDTIVVGTGLQLQGTASARFGATRGLNPNAIDGIHNMYLKVAHEAGVPALIGLLLIILAGFQQAWRLALNTSGTALHGLAAAVLGASAAACVQAMFHPIVYQRYFWVASAMTTCLWAVRRNELRLGQPATRVPDAHGARGRPAAARNAGARPSR